MAGLQNMSKKSCCRVGVIGAGTVGSGVVQILLERAELLARRGGAAIELARVADTNRAQALAAGVPEALLVDDFSAVVDDPDIDVVVELVGGTGIAETIVRKALENSKPVVTANKALLAEKGSGLFGLAREKGLPLAFEAAVCGGIPLILALREGLIASHMLSLLGIVNGTCNYVLSEMTGKGVAYTKALDEAQAQGYAEADPTFDVEGIDSGHKLALLSALALETWIDFSALHIEGISNVDLMDLNFADYLGYTVKLLAVARPDQEAGTLFLSVHPALLGKSHPLANVQGTMNAVALHGDVVMESMFYGRGAGREPTASAVVADIVQIARSLKGDVCAPTWTPATTPHLRLQPMDDYSTRYYLRFIVKDEPGVLGRITTSLGRHNASIASVHQFEDEGDPEHVPISILTHVAREGDVQQALAEIGDMDFSRARPVLLRIEE